MLGRARRHRAVLDEPPRLHHRGAARLRHAGRERRRAGRRHGGPRRAASTPCSSTPRSCTRRAAWTCCATSSTRPAAAAPDLDAGLDHRGADRAASARRSGRATRPSSGCRAASTRRWPPLLVHRAIGDRLTCVFVDQGMMRCERGRARRRDVHRAPSGIPLIAVDAQRALPRQARRRHRPRAQAQDHRRGVHPLLRGGGAQAHRRPVPGAGHALPAT